MAVHGKATEIAVDQYDMTELFSGAELSVSKDLADTTTFRHDDKTFITGSGSATLSLDGKYDTTRQVEVESRLAVTPFVATFGPAGLAVGSRARLMAVNSANVSETTGIADLTLLNWSLNSTDKVTFGWSLAKPDVLVSGDTNGAAVDTGAAVTGALWVAHFHLHTLSATNVILTVQDSADGVTGWANIAGVTSGTLVAPGVVRVTGTGTTKRYIRAVSDFTGGASTGSYTIAFSRSAP